MRKLDCGTAENRRRGASGQRKAPRQLRAQCRGRSRRWLRLPAAVFLPLLGLLLLLLPRGGRPCYLTDGGARYYLETHGESAAEVLRSLGLELAPGDRLTERNENGTRRITVERAQTVTFVTPEGERTLTTLPTTAGALLQRLSAAPDDGLRLCCDPALPTFDGMRLELRAVREFVRERRETIPAATLRLESPALAAGETALLCPGRDGLRTCRERVRTENGVEVACTPLDAASELAPCARIELYGVEREARLQPTDAPDGGVLETASGELLKYSRVLQCEATAYSCEGRVGTTATGTRARVGAIAVDPRYIPYGTRMYVVSNDGVYVYGFATAEDCGGFRGWRIDLYFDTVDECWQFGRRACTVYVLDG